MFSRETAHSWSAIAALYRSLIAHGWHVEPMVQLVDDLMRSPYVTTVHAVTSHATLVIAQPKEFELSVEVLRIEMRRGRVHFAWHELSSTPVWERSVEAADAFATLEHFIVDVKKWYRR